MAYTNKIKGKEEKGFLTSALSIFELLLIFALGITTIAVVMQVGWHVYGIFGMAIAALVTMAITVGCIYSYIYRNVYRRGRSRGKHVRRA